jgi:murein DD-endopeptidase MepM/ murein hydrolase activator NlpD
VFTPAPEAPTVVVSSGTIARGETLDIVLRKIPLFSVDAASVASSLRHLFPPRQIRPGDPWSVTRSTGGALREFVIARGLTEYVVTASTGTGAPVASSRDIVLVGREKQTSGVLTSSVWESMLAADVPPDLIAGFADVFAWQIDFNIDPRGGDKFALLWEEKTDPSGKVRARTILAATYEGTRLGRKSAALFDGEYFDEEGGSMRRAFLSAPLAFRRISSRFSYRRLHPILKTRRPHLGIDYAAPTGTPVKSIGDGVVVRKGWKGGLGNEIEVRHNSVYSSIYGHLSRYAASLRAGKSVRQGDVIGYVGSTGLSTGPHLHFQVKQNGRDVNFLAIKLPPSKKVPADRRAAFDAVAGELFRRLKGDDRVASSPTAPTSKTN